MAQQNLILGTSDNDGTGDGLRTALTKVQENTTELYSTKTPSIFVWVFSKSDLPDPVSNIITLQDNYTYFFTSNVDLTGDRLIGGQNTTILGSSSENASITSTGLGVGVAMFTSVWTTPINNITLRDVDTALDIDGAGNNVALDWGGTNFLNIPNIGIIKNVSNWIYTKGAFLNSKGLKFDGNIGTIGTSNSLLQGDGLEGSIIEVLSTANITARCRIDTSSVIAVSLTKGITVNSAATINDEAFILNNVNFSGGGTYLGDINETSNKSLFIRCVGINNTFVNGQLYMQGNTTPTPTAGVFTKILGTTTPSADNSKYIHSNNRLTCDAAISRKYLIQCNLSFESGNNQVCEFGFYDSVLGSVRVPSRTKATSNGSGKAENVSFMCVVEHIQGDYLEIHCVNNAGSNNITGTDMNFLVTEIG